MTRRIVVLASLLAGCSIPASPPALTPVAPDRLGLTGAPALPIASDWWRGFGDPQLDRLVAEAVAGNPTLDVALARVRQAQAVLAARQADDGPDLSLDGNVQAARLSGRYTIPPPFAGSVRSIGQVQANLAWNLDLFGRQRAAIAGARASARAAALDLAAARLAIAGSVVQAYVDLARAERAAALAGRTVESRDESLRLVRVRIRNRLASGLDASAGETLRAQAQGALLRANGARALATNALAALAGRGPDFAAAIGPTTLQLDAALPVPAALPVDLLARRADIAAARTRIEAAAAGRQVARKAFYPNVNLAALAGLQAVGLGNLLSLDAGTLGAGPALSLPLFDNGRRTAELAGATAALDLATADYNDRVIGAVRDAADALALVANIAEQRARSRTVVRGLSETKRLNATRVATGLDSRLDIIDQDVRLLDAQLADVSLSADAARQRVALLLALGGGFSPDQDVRP